MVHVPLNLPGHVSVTSSFVSKAILKLNCLWKSEKISRLKYIYICVLAYQYTSYRLIYITLEINGFEIPLIIVMVDISSTTLSTALLRNEGSEENGRKGSQAAAGVHALSGTQGLGVRDPASWTLAERGKAIKAMLDQEINSQQGNGLGVEQYDLILTEILTLEGLRPPHQRLNLEEIIAMLATIFKKSYTGDKYQMIIEQVRTLENDSNLKENIRKGMNTNSNTYKDHQETYQPEVLEAKCEDVMEVEISRLSGTDFGSHTDKVRSVAMSVTGKFIVSGSDDKKNKNMEHPKAEGRVHIHRTHKLRCISGCECRRKIHREWVRRQDD